MTAGVIITTLVAGAVMGLVFRRYWPDAPFAAVLVVGMIFTTIATKLMQYRR